MCIEHLKDDHFILSPHPLEATTRYLLAFDSKTPLGCSPREHDRETGLQHDRALGMVFVSAYRNSEQRDAGMLLVAILGEVQVWTPFCRFFGLFLSEFSDKTGDSQLRCSSADCWSLWGSGVAAYVDYLGASMSIRFPSNRGV